jgi:2-methylisocitrate lyase-like PEP mutase family enzyme
VSVRERAERLRVLPTAPEILVLVNVWDVASAVAVASRPGCAAIATASAAVAAAHGYPDGERMPLPLVLAALERIVAAVDLPVTADLEAGFGDPAGTARAAVGCGAVGLNLEDGMRPLPEAAAAVADVVAAGAAEGVPLVVNARTDAWLGPGGHLTREQRLHETLARGRAFLEEGADCVFVPGLAEAGVIGEVVAALGRGRVSVLGVPGAPDPAALKELGVARVSYGPLPHRAALAALADLADGLLLPR